MNGPGKYDDLATYCREQAESTGVLLILTNGKLGPGFAVQADAATLAVLPELLETIAAQLRTDRERLMNHGTENPARDGPAF
ncbi:MAG TPA: hypothetical protein VGH74_07795 [Planctomycetaceae bacterium]|jgi:hypothetical protein